MLRLFYICAMLPVVCVCVEAQTRLVSTLDESREAQTASRECAARRSDTDTVFVDVVAARGANAAPPSDAGREASTRGVDRDGDALTKMRRAEGTDSPGCAGAEAPEYSGKETPVNFSGVGFGRPQQPPPSARKSLGDDEAVKSLEDDEAPAAAVPDAPRGFRWKAALEQSMLMLAIQHGYALTQPKTRQELRGPFFKDYFRSIRSLHGWADGGRFFTNYIAHPLQGATSGFIQVQNDPKGMRQQFGRDAAYWRSRFKAFAWSAAHSTQFELGLLSQASIGNVGMNKKLTYVDLVITPTLGTGLLITEDALDRYVVRRIEERSDNLYLRILARTFLNPSRSCANLFRFKKPWHRDNR